MNTEAQTGAGAPDKAAEQAAHQAAVREGREETLQKAVVLLNERNPKDRGEAYRLLKENGLDLGQRFFERVCKDHSNHIGKTLVKSNEGSMREAKRIARRRAHNDSDVQVVAHLDAMKEPDATFFAYKTKLQEGGWADSKILSYEKHILPHLDASKGIQIDPAEVTKAVAKLHAASNVVTRGDAFNVMFPDEKGDTDFRSDKQKKRDSKLYFEAVACYEAETNTVLTTSDGTLRQRNIIKQMHNMDAAGIKKLLETPRDQMTQDQKDLAFACWEACRDEGKCRDNWPAKTLPIS